MREASSKQPHAAARSAATSTRATTVAPAHPLHELQRTAGNQAVSRMLRVPRQGVIHPLAAARNDPGVRFRVPSFGNLERTLTDTDLNIPEDVFRNRVGRLLERMAAEKRLKSSEPVPDIIKKIFPGPGRMDEKEFNKVIDVKDRTQIYLSVLETDVKVRPADRPKLTTLFLDAAKLVETIESDDTGMSQVFGTKAANAKTIYAKIKTKLREIAKNVEPYVSTDYNLDDEELDLGGFAIFGRQTMHLTLSVVRGKNPATAKETIIHEAAHLADSSVTDHVYYKRPGFFGLDEEKKVANAAHYEELPRRELKDSAFVGQTFKPGMTESGTAQTPEERIKADAQNYTRQAWSAAVEVFKFIRRLRLDWSNGDSSQFRIHRALILDISRRMDLTVHEQASGREMITNLDVSIAESVVRAVSTIDYAIKHSKIDHAIQQLPPFLGPWFDLYVRDQMVADTVTAKGLLFKDPKRDKALIDWLVLVKSRGMIPKW